MFKSNLIDVRRNMTSFESGSIMKSLIPVVLENITCHRGKNLKPMTIHQRNAKSFVWRND